jgi:tetratricopeptide (TPR) repeat protein
MSVGREQLGKIKLRTTQLEANRSRSLQVERSRAAERLCRRAAKAMEGRCYVKAEDFYVRTLKAIPGCASEPAHIRALSGLENLNRVLGRYHEAEEMLQTAVRLAKEVFGDQALETCTVRNALAILFKYTGRFTEAAALYRHALKCLIASRGSAHPDVATI